MAIVDNDAADAFYDALKANLGWTPSPADDTKARNAWRAAMSGFLDYIRAHAVVTSTGADPQGGVVNSTGTIS